MCHNIASCTDASVCSAFLCMFGSGSSPAMRLHSEKRSCDISVCASYPVARYFTLTAGVGADSLISSAIDSFSSSGPNELRMNRSPWYRRKDLSLCGMRNTLSDVIKNDDGGWLHGHGFRPKSAAKICVQECNLGGHSRGRHRRVSRVRMGPAGIVSTQKVISQCSVSWRGQSLHA